MKDDAEITYIDRDSLRISDQVRKVFNPEAMENLAQSIEMHRVQFPLMVRPLHEEPGCYEVVAGERRVRGTDMVLARVVNPERYNRLPCIIRDLSASAALEMQLIENLQREQVSAREEAEGYARMLALTNAVGVRIYPTQQAIADRIGKSKNHVMLRLKLRLIHEALWDALNEGKVVMSQLMLVGGVPHQRDREELGKKLIAGYAGRPYTWRETEALVLGYRRSIRGEPFDTEDATLVPMEWKDDHRLEGGACTDCPHLTGNDVTLEGVDPLLCCNPRCFEKKVNIGWRAIRKAAEDEGRAVIDVDGADRFFDAVGGVRTDGIYVDLAQSPDSLSVGHYGVDEIDVWNALLEDTTAFAESLVVRHPQTLKVHYFLERNRAVELASENGHAAIFAKRIVKRDKGKGVRDKGYDDESRGGDFFVKAKPERKAVGGAAVDGKTVSASVARRAMVDELCAALGVPASITRETGVALVRLCLTLAAFDHQAPVLEYCGAIVDDKSTAMNEPELWAVVEAKLQQDLLSDPTAWVRWLMVICALGECSLVGSLGAGAKRLIEALKVRAEGGRLKDEGGSSVEELKDAYKAQDDANGIQPVGGNAAATDGGAPECALPDLISPAEFAYRVWAASGSINQTAEELGHPLNTVRTWHRRNGWKARRMAEG